MEQSLTLNDPRAGVLDPSGQGAQTVALNCKQLDLQAQSASQYRVSVERAQRARMNASVGVVTARCTQSERFVCWVLDPAYRTAHAYP